MPLKTRTWIVSGVVLILAATLVWHFASRQQERVGAPEGTAAVQPIPLLFTNGPSVVGGGGVMPSAPVLGSNLLVEVVTNGMFAARSDRLAYRLSNSSLPLGELVRSERAVLLRNALIDTARERPRIPEHLRAQGDPGAYIVQARGPLSDEFRALLAGAGAEIVSFVPNNAYLVRASAGVAGVVEASPLTQAVLPFEPYYKLDASLLRLAVNKELSPHALLTVVSFPRQAGPMLEAMKRLGAEPAGEPQATVLGEVWAMKVPADRLAEVAQVPEVQMLGVHFEKRPVNDLTRIITRISTNIPFTTNVPIVRPPESHYRTASNFLTGAGVIVAAADTGVDDLHPDLAGRIEPGSYTGDYDGHGTHVVGTFIGDGTASPLINKAALGSHTNAVFSGMAPRARAYVQNLNLADSVLQRNTALRGALISNNSWGFGGDNDYDIFAVIYDSGVRDSLPGVTGEQEVAYVFAAGNEGGGGDDGLNGIPGSVISPATGKNVITVGGSDLPRHITNGVYRCTTITNLTSTNIVCETNFPWAGMTDTNNQVSSYSSRGNVGVGIEGPFGRFKPDVVAPGSMLVSARSRNFNEPDGSTNTFVFQYNNLSIGVNSTSVFALVIPPNAISFTILTVTNSLSPTNLTLFLDAAYGAPPVPPALGTNAITLDANSAPALVPGLLFYSIGNTNHAPNANYDLVLLLTVTNNVGTYFTVLQQLNAPLKPNYRYEAGTSMAAPAVSGFLALIQEYLATNFNVRPSPALLKALAINGARSLSPNYNLQINAPINHQGWGLVNMSNSIPSGLTRGASNGPMHFYDQTLTNALATGGTETYEITVPDEAKSFPLRVTLVWTDPPGNPVTGIKLVNDLNLSVLGATTNTVVISTNSSLTNSTSLLWLGNNFPPGSDFTEPIVLSSTDTNVVALTNLAAVIDAKRDIVNNVENVYLQPPLASHYTVIVKAHRVNVQAVNSHSNRLAQDYALVISSGNVVPTNNVNLLVTGPVFTNDFAPRISALLRATNATSAGLLNQRVGANNPLIISTNGASNQWAFFTYTNVPTANFTNVAILTFLPPNLSLSRYREADIDLYVGRGATGSNLFLLSDPAIAASDRSVRRGGTEVLIFTNAQPDEVFYIGVKSEDQQAANFALYALSSNVPFSGRDGSNNIIVSARGLPIPIGDGLPEQPAGTNIIMIVDPRDQEQNIARIYVTNAIYHEEAGDLIGILTRLGGTNAVTLNNHRTWTGWENPVFPNGVIYDDSGQGDLGTEFTTPPVFLPDGPGRLRDFIGEQAGPAWDFIISDNAFAHTGYVDNVTLVIEPASTNTSNPNVLIDRRFCVGPGTWVYAAANIPNDAYNMETCVFDFESFPPGGSPIAIYIKEGNFPDFGNFDHFFDAAPPGECLDIGLGDNPPLFPGRWYFGFYNSNAAPVCYHVRVTISRKAVPGPYAKYVSGDTPKRIIDDARTNSTIFVPDRGRIADLRVGLRVDHERAADLAFHLTSPTGTKLLLMENRGRTNARGIGVNFTNVVTNVIRTVLKEGFDNTPPRGCATPVNDTIRPPEIFAGWRVVQGSVDVTHDTCGFTGPAAHSQPHALDLDGQDPGTVETNITTIPGKRYRLSFAYSQIPGFGAKSNWVHLTGQPSFVLVSDQPNTASNLRWQTTSFVFTATSVGTLLQLESLSACCSGGMYFDTFQMDELEVKTNLYIYAGFTENTNLASLPIKFAVPPFGSTNINFQVPVKDDFETALPGEYPAPASVEGWSVATNQVSVIDDPTLAHSGNRLLALADAQITRTFPTKPGFSYTVSFAYRDSGIESWWPAEADYQDIVSGNTGTPFRGVDFRPGEVNFGFDFPGTGRSPRIDVGDPENLKLTESLTIEGWVFADTLNPGNLGRNHIIFRGADDSARDSYKLSIWETDHLLRFNIDDDTTEVLLLYPNPMPEREWLHITATLEDASGLMKLYTNGSLIAQLATGIRPYGNRAPGRQTPHVCIGNHPLGAVDNSWDGVIDELSIYHRALSPSEVQAIYRAGSRGKYDPLAPTFLPQVAKARVEIEGGGDLLLADSSWQIARYTFTATSNSATVRIGGYALGILLDGFEAKRDDVDTEWYLPEEPLTPFFGENAFGRWTLEVWDSRLGGAITNLNPQLLSWRLDLAYPQGNPPSTLLTNGSRHTAVVRGAETRYFIVDLPCSSGLVTNTLSVLSPTTAGLNLTFNNFTLPTNGSGDVVLLSAVKGTGISTLPIGTFPLVSPPRYYLAVQNVDPNETNAFALSIDVDCRASPLVALANNKRHAATIGPGMLHEYVYTTANDSVQLTFEVTQAGANVDLLVQRDTRAGISENPSYASRRPGTANEWIVLTTNSMPVPLAGAGPWYAAVENISAGTPPYFVKATEVRQARVRSILANITFAQENLPPSEIDYFVVNLPTNILNAVFNLTVNAGEADLYLGQGTFPTTTLYAYQSTWEGSDYQSIGTPLITPGEWRIAVANPSTTTASSYLLNALVSTNANPGDGVTIQTSSSQYTTNEFALKWTAPADQEFRVEYTDALPPQWIALPGSVTSTNGQFVFMDFSSQTGQRFYRVVRVR